VLETTQAVRRCAEQLQPIFREQYRDCIDTCGRAKPRNPESSRRFHRAAMRTPMKGITMAQIKETAKPDVQNALVEKSLEGKVGTITLNNRAKLNALSAPLIEELIAALSDLTNSEARGIGSNALAVAGCIPMVPGAFAAKGFFGLYALTAPQPSRPSCQRSTTTEYTLRVLFTLVAIGTGLSITKAT